MKVSQIVSEAPEVGDLTGLVGTKVEFTTTSKGKKKLVTGTIVGPSKDGDPKKVSVKMDKGPTFNVSANKLRGPDSKPLIKKSDTKPKNDPVKKVDNVKKEPYLDKTKKLDVIDKDGKKEPYLLDPNDDDKDNKKQDNKKQDTKKIEKDVDKSITKTAKEWGKGLFKFLKGPLSFIFGNAITNVIIKAIDIAGIVSLHNSYFDQLKTLVLAKVNKASDDELKEIQTLMFNIRKEIVQASVDLTCGSVGMALGSATFVGVMVVGSTIATILTGGVAAPLSVATAFIVGCVASYGAYEGGIYACKSEWLGSVLGIDGDKSIYDYLLNKFDTEYLTPKYMRGLMIDSGGSIDYADYIMQLMMDPVRAYGSPLNVPGINQGPSIGGTIKAMGQFFNLDEELQELSRIKELAGVINEKPQKEEKIKVKNLDPEVLKFVLKGAKKIEKIQKQDS